jgi:hypothetical protein
MFQLGLRNQYEVKLKSTALRTFLSTASYHSAVSKRNRSVRHVYLSIFLISRISVIPSSVGS